MIISFEDAGRERPQHKEKQKYVYVPFEIKISALRCYSSRFYPQEAFRELFISFQGQPCKVQKVKPLHFVLQASEDHLSV